MTPAALDKAALALPGADVSIKWGADRVFSVRGKMFAATNKVNDQMPDVKWDEATKTLVLGEPLLITNENVDQFNY